MGYVFTLSGSVVSWKVTWQATNCFIDHGGRHMTLSQAVKKALWLRSSLVELDPQRGMTIVFCDGQSAIHLTKKVGMTEAN